MSKLKTRTNTSTIAAAVKLLRNDGAKNDVLKKLIRETKRAMEQTYRKGHWDGTIGGMLEDW